MRLPNGIINFFDPLTGEIFERRPEFTKMSLKPGISNHWFQKFSTDVFPNDYVVVRGRKCRPPRYYDNLFAKATVDSYYNSLGELVEWSHLDMVKEARRDVALLHLDDNTEDRLRVKEQVLLAKLSLLKRKLS